VEQFLFEFAPPERTVYSVSALSAALRGMLEREFFDVWISGEISGTKLAASGHYYFTLKDSEAQLKCVCFRSTARFLKFKPQDGVAVIARGRLDLYEARGEYQLLVEVLEPQGYGALQLAYEQLKKKLAAEGLFAAERKRALPRYPRRIGIITSPQGAVIQDMLQILERRFPGLHIRVFPALVQGEGSVEDVCRGLDYFSRSGWPDVVIVARGGGSLEDLWAFNEERVARAIAACAVPVVSAVGHETDFTIADFVADLRAPTPSAAAELVTATRQSLVERLRAGEGKLRQASRLTLALAARRLHAVEIDAARLHRTLGRRMQRVDELDYRLRGRARARLELSKRGLDAAASRLARMDVRLRVAEARRRLEGCEMSVVQGMRLKLSHARAALAPPEAHLIQLSPLKILDRGYAIVERGGKLVKSPADAPAGSDVRVRLAHGELSAKVQ
jgi:exodeoxyribonuclease VII large subunit